jgi:hypothetical protein
VRARADVERLRRFMAALGREAASDTRVYFTGGATAVLLGWRASTLDADILVVPKSASCSPPSSPSSTATRRWMPRASDARSGRPWPHWTRADRGRG